MPGTEIRNIKRTWPTGTPLPAAGIFFFYDPTSDAEYKVAPSQVSGGLRLRAYLTLAQAQTLRDTSAIVPGQAYVVNFGNDGNGYPQLVLLSGGEDSDNFTQIGELRINGATQGLVTVNIGAGTFAPLGALPAGPLTGAQLRPRLRAGTGIDIELDGNDVVINCTVTPAAALPRPAAPTAGQVDDMADTFSFLPNPDYPSFAQYKINGLPGVTGAVVLDSQNSYVQGSRVYIKVVGAVPAGGLAVYVAGSGSLPDGKVLSNADVFTGTAVTPIPGDTLAPNISLTVPAPGATLTAGQVVTLTATATDNVAVTEVVFTNGATSAVLGTGAKNGTTYTLAYTPTATGALTLTATASDAAGNSQAASVTVHVQSATKPIGFIAEGDSTDAGAHLQDWEANQAAGNVDTHYAENDRYADPSTGAWPALLVQNLGAGHVLIANKAHSGQTVQTMLNERPYQLDQHLNATTLAQYSKIYVLVGAGVNSLGYGATAQDTYNQLKAYCQYVVSQGGLPIIKTLTATGDAERYGNGVTTASLEAKRQQLLTLIRNGVVSGDLPVGGRIYDFAALPGLDTPANIRASNYITPSVDYQHPNAAGHQYEATNATTWQKQMEAGTFVYSPPAPATYGVENVVWADLVGATASGNSLTYQATCSAHSSRAIPSTTNTTRGYLELTIAALDVDSVFGLSSTPAASNAVADIPIGINIGSAGVRSFGTVPGQNNAFTAAVVGDVIRMTVTGGNVVWTKNGTQFATSPATGLSSDPLQVDVGAFKSGSVNNVVIAGWGIQPAASSGGNNATAQPVTWTGLVNATASGSDLTIQGSGSSAYATVGMGATSQQVRGIIKFTVPQIGVQAVIGFDDQPSSSSGFSDMPFAWHVQPDGSARPFGSQAGGNQPGYNIAAVAITAGTELEMRILQNSVVFLINGSNAQFGEIQGAIPSGPIYFDVSGLTGGTITDAKIYAASPV